MNIEGLFSAVSPQSTFGGQVQSPAALENLALAAAGMPEHQWNALCWRFLRDQHSWLYLHHRLANGLINHRSQLVRDRSSAITRLVLAEEHHLIEDADAIGHIMLHSSRRHWREVLRPVFLRTRAQLDLWARAGLGLMRSRLR